jgi:carbamoyltransferase
MSTILGINNFIHDTSVALVIDGEITCLLEEEKLTGVKSCYNIWANPTKSLEYIETKYGITLDNCDHIVFSLPRNNELAVKHIHHDHKIHSYSHHKCHGLGSYFTSDMDGKVMVVTIDGRGNQSRGKVYLCEDGNYEEVLSHPASLTASLANLWGNITRYIGWVTFKDEGKIVGLAAHGKYNERIYNLLKKCFYYDGNLGFGPSNGESMTSFIFDISLRKEGFYDSDENKKDLAFNLQLLSENEMNKYLNDLHKKYPEYKKLCLAGGLFSNVKLNKTINDLEIFDEIFIHPSMGDGGLALGAALVHANILGEIKKPFRLNNCFLGQDWSKSDWETQLEIHNDKLIIEEMSYEKVGSLINDGYVVGVFVGRTEYGPRSLGNRSIVVKPTDKHTHQRLNEKLKRTEIMPFAPSILEEFSDLIFQTQKSKYTAEFMTLCYDTQQNWLDRIPAVVHEIDGSARPQIVNKEKNPNFYNIINEYYKKSGIPVVLNTSFNAHGEPINNYPHQVMNHLFNNCVDYIVTEDFIIRKNEEIV